MMHCQKAKKNICLAMSNRLEPPALTVLHEHLRGCPSCQEWQRQQSRLQQLIKTQPGIQLSQRFHAALQDRINNSPVKSRLFAFYPNLVRPGMLRVAMFLLLTLSTVLGFFLGGPVEMPEANAAAFSQTMNLDAFSDLPADSFGAVYSRLLQGDLQ
jgi:predicted anti-sigma-YlaC factor YlaD